MDAMTEVGGRIRARMPKGMSQRNLAERAGMTPDALSRALNGQRGLSPVEVAKIAQVIGADTHWLITGHPDPFTVSVAARHSWDVRRRKRVNDGHQEDQAILEQVVTLYRAAFPHGPAASIDLPKAPEAVRQLLGESFVRAFADVIEARLGVDVIRIQDLTTDYSLRIGGHGVIVLATQSSWFRSNWSLAHELGHLALDHHSSYESPRRIQGDEQEADQFAAALLLPSESLRRIRDLTDAGSTADLVWELGVSTEAIRNQLSRSRIRPSASVAAALTMTTPRLLRAHLATLTSDARFEPLVLREQQSSARRFPVSLLSALQERIEAGAASPELLAWALDVPIDDLDFPEPIEETATEISERLLRERPTTEDWREFIAATAGRA